LKRSVYVFSNGTLKRKQNTLYIENETGKKYLPIEQVGELHIFGEVTLNTKLLGFLSQREVLVHVYSHYGYYMGTYYPREHYNSGYMTLKQAEHYLNPQKRIDLARRFVEGAIANLRQVLRYYINRGKPLNSIERVLQGHQERLCKLESIEQLMQTEGQAREAYYQAFDLILDNPDFVFKARTRRPPQNRLNALISFGNSLLYTAVLSEIYKTHLDPRIGFLHATNFRRFTLNLDVAEVFKPIYVDRLIISLIQKRQIQTKHFDTRLGGIYLKEEGQKKFLNAWEERLQTTIYHRGLRRNASYRRLIRLELYKLEKHLLGEQEYKPFRARW